jgi:hypothetical protein
MRDAIVPPRSRRSGANQEFRSQVFIEILLNLYAVVGAFVVIRALLLTIGVTDRVWIGRTIYRATRPLVLPFSFIPGSDFTIVGSLTLTDVTLLAGVVLFPLALLVLSPRAAANQPR